jgi:dTDP-4-dehydrorhamnose reductase
MEKIMITGASSYVGARLYRDLQNEHEVVGTYNTNHLLPEFVQLDATDAASTNEFIISQKPDVIIHTANNASVKWCEANPEAARLLNEDSTRTIVDSANEIGARAIYISSFAANNPVSVYGKAKLASEETVRQATCGWLIIRPSLIVGLSPNTVNDRFFNRILGNIHENTDASYDSSRRLQLSSLAHISKVIRQAISQSIVNKTIPVATDEAKSQYDFARDTLRSFNIEALARDKGTAATEPHIDLDILSELGLPTYSYPEIIKEVVAEIQQHETKQHEA